MSRIAYIEDMKSWMEEFTFHIPVKVRFNETDMFGHVNNTVPFTYFEEARIEFFKHIRLFDNLLEKESQSIPVVADLQCDFLKQMYFDDRLQIYVKAQSVGNSSVDLHYMVKREDNTVCLTGRGAVVKINPLTGKSVPWTEEEKSRLKSSTA